MPAFEVYPKRKFCVVAVLPSENQKCFLANAIYEMNIKKEVIEKKNTNCNFFGQNCLLLPIFISAKFLFERLIVDEVRGCFVVCSLVMINLPAGFVIRQ
jgi:hypothetical protein